MESFTSHPFELVVVAVIWLILIARHSTNDLSD